MPTVVSARYWVQRVQMSEVRLSEYQEKWPSQYAQVAAELRSAALGPDFVLEHIGSTAVTGLCAKPVLDVLLGVATLDVVESRISALASLGFAYRPEYELRIPDRRYFVRPEGTTPRVHLHAVDLGGALWLQHLRFRDALRDNAEIMRTYADLKRHLAVLHAADKAAYTEAKAPFIRRVLDAC